MKTVPCFLFKLRNFKWNYVKVEMKSYIELYVSKKLVIVEIIRF